MLNARRNLVSDARVNPVPNASGNLVFDGRGNLGREGGRALQNSNCGNLALGASTF